MLTLLRLTIGLPRLLPRLSVGGGDATRLRCAIAGGGDRLAVIFWGITQSIEHRYNLFDHNQPQQTTNTYTSLILWCSSQMNM